jgi:hypothetical protein
MVAVAVALTALVAGSGMSAAVTGGRSVNPLDGIQHVVAELRGGRTPEQREALAAADGALDRAVDHVRARQYDRAREELAAATALLPKLSSDDRETVKQRITNVGSGLRR